MSQQITYFADILLPLPLPLTFTYRIPSDLTDKVAFGIRVVVPFGKNKLYSGIIIKVHTTAPSEIQAKYLINIIDSSPIITERQFALWQWIADYYMCSLGEVMSAALPSALKLAGETQIALHPNFDGDISTLTERELSVIQILNYHPQISLSELTKIIEIKKIFPIVKSLVEKDIIIVSDEIINPYKPKKECFISLNDVYKDEKNLLKLLDELALSKQSEKQLTLLLAFLSIQRQKDGTLTYDIKKSDLLKKSNCSVSSLQSLIKKNVFIEKSITITRLVEVDSQADIHSILLSDLQNQKVQEIKNHFNQFDTVLLHGVTGSGKTEMYMNLIDEVLQQGKQVLYLLPEIALTSQIVNRLRLYFGHKVGVYHSRFNEYERVEIWNRVLNHGTFSDGKYSLILGARSALLLPFQNLGLIIVDEEHDASYKQQDPAPRYHARDAAIVLANIHHAKTLLGTATPSLESYYNTMCHKFALVELKERFANSTLPDIWIENLVEARRQKKMTGPFSQFLIDSIQQALDNKEQVILFQNRRGYAVRLFCNTCQSMPTCVHCDVTLTYHKHSNILKCHYCGYAIDLPSICPTCHSSDIEMKGFGTEKIEETLESLFPSAVVERMDLDTTRSKTAYQRIIHNFETHHTDILVGTQMVTKGLDFDRVSVVGILEADNLLSYPDFRSFERAFQTLSQVSGRAGRKDIPGKVIIQTYQPWHPALNYVVGNNYIEMYRKQIEERKTFHYPPMVRLIKITLKHPNMEILNAASDELLHLFLQHFKGYLLGPEFPLVSRIQNYYLKDFWLKLPKDSLLNEKKALLNELIENFRTHSPNKAVRIIINVDC